MQIVFTFQPISEKPTELLKCIIGCFWFVCSFFPPSDYYVFCPVLLGLFLIVSVNQALYLKCNTEVAVAYAFPLKHENS